MSQLASTIAFAFLVVAIALFAMGIGWFFFRKKTLNCAQCGYKDIKETKDNECPLCHRKIAEKKKDENRAD